MTKRDGLTKSWSFDQMADHHDVEVAAPAN